MPATLTRIASLKGGGEVIFSDLSAQRATNAALAHHFSDAIIATVSTGTVANWNPAAEAIYRRPAARVLALPASEAVNGYVLFRTDQTALQHTEQYFQTVVATLDYGVAVIGSDGRVESCNPAADRIFGTSPEVLKNRPPHRALDFPIYDTEGDLIGADRHPLTQIRRTGTQISDYVFGVDRFDGQRVWVSASYRLLNADDPQQSAVLISLTDITAQHTTGQRLAYQATHDSLTGLPNRSHVVTRVTEAQESGGHDALAAILFIDLDNLKTTNDLLGHDAGDDVLRVAAQRLCGAVRSDDVVARLGGDEFVVLLNSEITPPDLDALAKRIHAALAKLLVIEGATLRIGASIGIVVIENNDPRSAAQLLRDADTAMYAAKATGRGKSHYFTEQLRDRERRHPTRLARWVVGARDAAWAMAHSARASRWGLSGAKLMSDFRPSTMAYLLRAAQHTSR